MCGMVKVFTILFGQPAYLTPPFYLAYEKYIKLFMKTMNKQEIQIIGDLMLVLAKERSIFERFQNFKISI